MNEPVQVETVEVTGDQLQQACALVRQNPALGHALALRQAGVQGTKGQLNTYVDGNEHTLDALTEARHGRIRDELLHRAIDGDEEAVYNGKGDYVGTRIVKSDRLLDLAVRLYLPEARRLQRGELEVSGPGGGPVTVQRGVSLADVAAVLTGARALPDSAGAPRQALPAAAPVLAEPLPEA